MFSAEQLPRRVLISALVAMALVLGTMSFLISGFSNSPIIKLMQVVAVFGLGAVVVGGAAVLVLVQVAGWKDPNRRWTSRRSCSDPSGWRRATN